MKIIRDYTFLNKEDKGACVAIGNFDGVHKGHLSVILEDYGRKLGFGVTIAPLVEDNKGIFSSTSIRNAITDGRPDDAAHMLGHWYRIEGTVISGDQRGRELGYPTANMSLDGLNLP